MAKSKKNVLKTALVLGVVLAASLIGGVSRVAFANHSAANNDNICGNHDNVRYRNCAEKEAYDNCGVEHQGAIWMSQAQDFTHDQSIVIDTVGNTVKLYLQGSVYTCKTAKPGNKAVYACNISFKGTDKAKFDLAAGNDLYRGTSTTSKYTFFEPDSTHNGLAVNVDVSSIAPGATDTFSVGINRIYGWGGCSGGQTSGSYQTTTINVKITRKNEWKVTPTTTTDRATVKPTEKITWTHKIQSNGGNPPSVRYGYTSSNAGSSNKTAWADDVGVAGSKSKTSEYIVPAGTAEGTIICRNTVVNPSEGSGGSATVGEAVSTNSCVTVEGMSGSVCQTPPLGGMVLTKPGSYTPAIQLSNVATLPAFSYRIYKQGGVIPGYTSATAITDPALKVTGSSPNQKLSVTVNFTPATPGTYVLEWQVMGYPVCSASATVGTQPYFTVEGGDILGGFKQLTSLIASWNGGVDESYSGAGTTLAAIAGKDIKGFITSSSITGAPSRLAFANTPSKAPPLYGGNFADIPEEPDYYGSAFGTAQTCTPTLTTATLQSGLYDCPGNVTLNGGILPAGIKVTIKTVGTVFIAGDITYAPYGLTDIPRLNVITNGGNIVVSSTVTAIHGVFIAQGSASKFYSCGSAAGVGYEYTNLGNPTSRIGECSTNKLTVYGSVVAGQLILGRTSGSWTQAGSNAAETFVHSPETWLSKPLTSGTGATQTKFDSYISLPPVL